MFFGFRLGVSLMMDPAVRAVRHEAFASGDSAAVRRLNRPGRLNQAAASLLAATLDGPEWLRRFVIRRLVAPGEPDEAQMDDQWVESTVGACTFGMYHPSGTCRMGRENDPGAVLDPTCRARGTDRLSVVDASVMPTIIRGNTNIPTIMVAEKAADLLLRPEEGGRKAKYFKPPDACARRRCSRAWRAGSSCPDRTGSAPAPRAP